jgi:hypothetical protein
VEDADHQIVFETMIPWDADEADLWDNALFPDNQVKFVVMEDAHGEGYGVYVEGDKSRWWSNHIKEESEYIGLLATIQENPSVLTLLRLEFDVDYTRYWEYRQ